MYRLFIVSYLVITNNNMLSNGREMFTINTEGCKIPAFPLFTDSLKDLVGPPSRVSPNCTEAITLVTSNSSHIWVDHKLYNYYNIFLESDFYCCYRNFSAEGTIGNIAYGKCQEFTTNIQAKHEFVRVECFKSANKIYEDLFRFNNFNLQTVRRRDEKSFNILMLGIDSISRKNFLRTMSKTSNFLKSRGSIQLYGYNKLGDDTYANLFPILTGKDFNAAKEVCWKANMLDSRLCKFMWDAYRSAGFYTAMGADTNAGTLGAYEYMLPYKPTDFYLQPFMYETRHFYRDKTSDYHLCLQNRYLYKELLNYIRDTIDVVQHGKLFGFFWEESVSHGRLNYPYIMDDDYLNFLTDLEKSKYLDDTVVIFFSDHGTRLGDMVANEQGRQESRLPLFEIMFPRKFRRRYKLAVKNFEMNSRVLTSAHDIYETLLDLINTSSLEDRHIKERIRTINIDTNGISLFLPIPYNRTCKSVGISEHWCTCVKGDKVAVGSKGKIFTAKYLLQHINQILSEYNQCHKLGVDKILDVTATKNDQLRTYRVLVKTNPGGGVFEGTLLQDGGRWTVSGTVSRLNLYKNEKHCVKDPIVKMYCHCRK